MLRRLALVRTDISEERIASIIGVTRIGWLYLIVTANVIPSSPILVALMLELLRSSETSVITRVIRRHIPKDGILHGHRRENLKSYFCLQFPRDFRQSLLQIQVMFAVYILHGISVPTNLPLHRV
jgi:hypothetical protein